MKIKVNILGILVRYSLLILSSLFNLWIFYFIFTPFTIYPVYVILNYFLGALLNGNNIILISGNAVGIMEMIPACIAGAAYFLLFILNMSVPNIKLKKRIQMILISFLSLLVLNIIRIIILGTLLISGSSLFDITHKIFWYVLSTIFVVGIWFAEVKIFRIKDIPVFSDIKSLIYSMKKTRKSKRSSKY
jgi:exosortase/archaeosortase family protein